VAFLTKLALFLVPLAVLAASPNLPFLAVGVTLGYLLLACVSTRLTTPFHWGWLYAYAIAIYLPIEILRTPTLESYGLYKGLYVLFLALPFALAVSALVSHPRDLRWIGLGYVALGSILSILALALGSRTILGPERYTWQGNLSAIAGVLVLQSWFISNPWLAIPLFAINLLGLAVAAAKQSLAVLIIGCIFMYALNISTPQERRRLTSAAVSLCLILPFLWPILPNIPVFERLLFRLSQIWTWEQGLSFQDRGVFWESAWDGFLTSPLIGNGIGSFARISGHPYDMTGEYLYPHNILLEVLSENGLIGFVVIFGPVILTCFAVVLRYLKEPNRAYMGILSLFASATVISSLSGDLTNRIWWLFAFIMLRFLSEGALAGRRRGVDGAVS
jgi:O-antigen ligase